MWPSETANARHRPEMATSPDALVHQRDRAFAEAIGFSASDAAALLGISESHFYNLHKTGRLGPLPTRMGRAVRWSRQELVEWFNAGSPPRNKWTRAHRK
jgi:excisionase family DNA binding protein